MAEFIEILSQSALKDLQTANVEVLTLIKNIDNAGKSMQNIKTPSGSDSAVKQLNIELQKQADLIKDLQKQLESLANSKKNYNQKTTEEIVNQQVLRKNAVDHARANSTLAGSYANLSAQVSIASKRYQDLIVRGKTAEQTQRQYNKELRNAQKEFQTLQTKVLQADKAVDKWNRTGERSLGFMRDLIGAFGISMGVQLFVDLGREILTVTKELQSLDLALKQVTETQSEYSRQFFFLQKVSQKWGVELNGLTKQFTQFYVSAKDKISGNQIQEIFESITKAGALMGLSTQQQERAFLALNQMMSKGTIQAEELRGQLGEALPGAFGIMAKAMGVSEKELGKLMKDGKVLASEVLPKFAKELEKAYNIINVNTVDTLTSAQNRLTNAWVEFIRELENGDGVLSRVSKRLTEGFAIGIQNLTYYMKSDATKRKEHYAEIREEARKTATDFINSKDTEEKKLNLATKGIEKYKNKLSEAYIKAKELENKLRDLRTSKNPNVRDQNGRGLRGYWEKVFKKESEDLFNLNVQIQKYRGMIDGLESVLIKNKTNTDDDETKKKREKLKLTFDEIESEYNLKLAILERQKAERNDRATNEDSLFEDRIKARKEYSDKSIEILELETQKEKALIQEKYLDDLDKNNLAYKNKDINSQEWSKNIQDITKRTNNELATIDLNYSLKWNDLLNENAKFYRDIQDKNREYTEQTNKLILDGEKSKYEKISNDSKKTLTLRQKAFEQYIELSKKELEIQKIKDLANAKSDEEIILISQKYAVAIAKLEDLSSPIKKAREETEEFIQKIASGQLEKSLNEIGVSSAKMFLDFDANGQTTFDKLLEGADTFKEKFAVVFQAVGDTAQDIFNKITELSNQRFTNELTNLEREKEIAILFAGESASAREEIERQYEARQRDIKNREAKAKKGQAIFNILIDTAQGVVSALASTPPNVPLSIAIGAIGAIQAGIVASQQVPQFYKGTDNAPEGFALTQEKGAEIITDKSGKIKSLGNNKGAQMTYLSKGDKVFTAEQSTQLMHNQALNSILTNSGIMPTQIVNNSTNVDITPIVNAINNKESFSMNIDKGGLNTFVKNGHTTREITNRRIQGQSYGV